MCLDCKLDRVIRLLLGHCGVSAVSRVVDEGREVGIADLTAYRLGEYAVLGANVYGVAYLFLADVTVLAQLDVALASEDNDLAVAPGLNSLGREPVDTNVACDTVFCGESCIAKVVKTGVILVEVVGNARGVYRRIVAISVCEELEELMRADIDKNSTGVLTAPEPIGA